jgi:hypothetical protein
MGVVAISRKKVMDAGGGIGSIYPKKCISV